MLFEVKMCTALSFNNTEKSYFGRNLDLDRSFLEEVVVLPRKYPLAFRKAGIISEHYAVIGMATVVSGVPLFYDGANEHGLAIAGLNFPENAYYEPPCSKKLKEIAPFELIWYVLGKCRSVFEARKLLEEVRIVDIPFSDKLRNSPLHFIISDKSSSITVEPMKDGLHVYDNPEGILTNNPPFPYQLENLERYEDLRTDNSSVIRNTELSYSDYCQGLGAVGLPGDLSSMSRFVRIAFGKKHSVRPETEEAAVGQFFHLLSAVSMTKGLCVTDEGTLDHTVYSSCINTDRGIYYYKTYGNSQISAVDMVKCNLDSIELYRYPLFTEENIKRQN